MSSTPYTTDTSTEADAVQLECIRKMSPQVRLDLVCGLSTQLRTMAFDAIRRRHPELSDAEVQIKFVRLTYGDPLGADFERWMLERGRV